MLQEIMSPQCLYFKPMTLRYDKKCTLYAQKCIPSFIHMIYYACLFLCICVCTVNCNHIPTQKYPETDTQSDSLEKEKQVTIGRRKRTIGVMPEPKLLLPKKRIKTVKVALVPPEEQAIVLLHGLHRLSYDFLKMEQRLKEKFPKAAIVALKSLNKESSGKKNSFSPTMVLPIQEQATLAYEEIKSVLVRNKQVVVVGHSQGGLRGFAVVRNHGHPLAKDQSIVIRKLITIGTPWKGAPVMNHLSNPHGAIQELNKVKKTLNKIEDMYSKHLTRYILKTSIAENFPFLFKHLGRNVIDRKTPGVAELRLDSDFIKNFVATGLEQVTIPIRAIAGVLVDFSHLFSPFPSTLKKQELQKLNKAYATLIGGNPTCEHDMLLPVETQHAEGLRKRDFKTVKIYGACHGNKVGLSVKQGLSELNNDKVIQAVIALVEESFYEEKQIEEGVE
ncbi:MAG TPA: hypothetical protein VK133_04035 [Amoebophilaceae bacterium]|nr:hypothetical protein [Amoebophilaceae bacterium]